MNVLGDMLTGNPLGTTVGQRIDKATSRANETEDWAMNMEICDIINETEEGPKDAIRALRKKLSASVGKDWRSVIYTLVVLETCVKNCGRRFHLQLAQKDFLNELVKIITPKNEPSVQVQEKVLGLIQTWADAFKGSSDLKAVEMCYMELKSKGIEFPATDMDNLAPIHTPKQHESYVPPPSSLGSRPSSAAAPRQPVRTSVVPPAGDRTQQLAKLREDISIVQGNCRVFNEMLNVTTTSEASPDTLDLMRELNRTCRQMQQRIVVLLEQLSNEQVTEVLLRVNDDLNNAFLRYDRVERSQPPSQTASTASLQNAVSQPSPEPVAAPAKPNESSLIDFGFDPPPQPAASPAPNSLASQLDTLTMNSGTTSLSNVSTLPTATHAEPGREGNSDEFDMFIQSRKYDATSHSAADSYTFQSEAAYTDVNMGQAATGVNPNVTTTSQAKPTTTSNEFDQFLAERAAAGENLPDQPANRNQRQLKEDESENALFAL